MATARGQRQHESCGMPMTLLWASSTKPTRGASGTRCERGSSNLDSNSTGKTRLLEFGRYAAERRRRRGLGKPETFTFLGFIFICGRSRRGAFLLHRKTRGDRMRAKLREIKASCASACMPRSLPRGGGSRRWSPATSPTTQCPRTSGHSGRSDTTSCISGSARFGAEVRRRHDVGAHERIADDWLPTPASFTHGRAALCRQTPKVGAGCLNCARPDLCGGRPVTGISTAINTIPVRWRHEGTNGVHAAAA